MDIIKLAEIHDQLELLILDYPFYNSVLIKKYDFENTYSPENSELRSEGIVFCSEFVQDCKNWITQNPPPYRSHVLDAIKKLEQLSVHQMNTLHATLHRCTSDFLIDLPNHLREEGKNIIDVNTGYPPHYLEDILTTSYNPKYQAFIEMVLYVQQLLLTGLRYVLEEGESEGTEIRTMPEVPLDILKPAEPESQAENDKNFVSYKVHLLHKLGILEPLKKVYKEKNPGTPDKRFSEFMKELLGAEVKTPAITRAVTSALQNEDKTEPLKRYLARISKEHNLD